MKCKHTTLHLLALAAALLLPSCIATAPVSIAWRSNANLQHATTEGKTTLEEASPTVNAERTSATDLKVAKEITDNAQNSAPQATGSAANTQAKTEE